MKVINPYLNFAGNSKEAFDFYRAVFNGTIVMSLPYKDTPEANRVKPEDRDKLMHISLDLKNGNILMGTDALENMGHKLNPGNNINLSIGTESKEEADQLFNALSDGANVTVPMSTQFWGSYFGMLTDKFGIQWMVSFDGR
ncbi:VOC family protein [Mucilaginibacter ginkgonis]|uniref:VOC family protein n=1 Tax=Mucilaginibacter ginkgonis TaxID=2682091 RepID=A0A6I4I2V0_9SPHI|nr:VOC family protein [Mucilaginibacter ginkgonis]QQL49175.1 VOC family protein [Mucilaginibacter ginkgonis]